MTFILFTSRILRTLFMCPFWFWAFVCKQLILCFDISSSFDMLPVILFLLVLIFICLWNCQLYAYFLHLAFYSLAHLWGFEHLGPLTLLLGLCESVTFIKAVSLLSHQPNNRLCKSVTSVKAVGLFKTIRGLVNFSVSLITGFIGPSLW